MNLEVKTDKLCKNYGVEGEHCQHDADAFLSQRPNNKVVLTG